LIGHFFEILYISEGRVDAQLGAELQPRPLLKANIHFDLLALDELVEEAYERRGGHVDDPGEGGHAHLAHRQAHHQEEGLGAQDTGPSHQDRPALPRLQVPQVVRPGHKGQGDEEDVGGEGGHVEAGEGGEVGAAGGSAAATALLNAHRPDLLEGEGVRHQQGHHGDEEPQGVAPDTVPHHVPGGHHVTVFAWNRGNQ
jgi:hypothetical protein